MRCLALPRLVALLVGGGPASAPRIGTGDVSGAATRASSCGGVARRRGGLAPPARRRRVRHARRDGAWRALLIFSLLLVATVPAHAQGERDFVEEVRQGALVHLYLSYSGGTTGSRTGSEGPNSLSETRTTAVRWETPVNLEQSSPGVLTGDLVGEYVAGASSSRTWDHRVEDYSLHEEETCEASGYKGRFHLEVEGAPEEKGIRVAIRGYSVASLSVEGACRATRVETTLDGTSTTSRTGALGANVAMLHAIERGDHGTHATFLVPYNERSTHRFSYREGIPHAHDAPAGAYCGMGGDAYPWAAGTCSAEGTLTVLTFVYPCEMLKRAAPRLVGDLEAVQPPAPTATEADVRVWAEGVFDKVRAVLGNERSWQLAGCPGELEPDPWDALVRAHTLHRDALLRLLREGKLSQQGKSELLGAERSLQLTGGEGTSPAASAEAMAAAPPAPSGTMEVEVHSPVSIHVWDEHGGHVGWDDAAGAPVSTIPGGRYEGAPGGAQTIVVPAGFYKVTVDELSRGHYLLEVRTNGTGADTEEAFLVESATGRTTSTHYAVTDGWDGPRLDVFPVRRGPTSDAVTFVDPVERPGVGTAAGDGARGAPGPSLGGALLLLLGVALLARRR